MVNELSYVAKAKNNAAKYVLLGLIVTSMIFVIASNLATNFSGVLWVFALGFITATIYVYNKNVGSEYCYSVTNEGGRPTFLVSMKVGKTTKIMARIDLWSISEIKRFSRKEYRAYKSDKGVIRYSYHPTMFADEVYFILVRSEHENADIVIEADESFIQALNDSL